MTDAELIAKLRTLGRDFDDWGTAADRIEALIAERDHWSGVARREGVCMTCRGPYGAPEPYGCSDCLNTGYCGEYHNTVADLEAKLAKAVEALEFYTGYDDGPIARATLAEIKSHSDEFATQKERGMSDEGQWCDPGYCQLAEVSNYAKELKEKLAKCLERNALLEARLGKAVEALKMMCEEFRGYDLPYGSKAYSQATAALAELKGESHE